MVSVSSDLLEMDAVAALLELGVTRIFNHNQQSSPPVRLIVNVPEVTATSTPKSPESMKSPGPRNPDVLKVSYGLIVHNNRTSESSSPKHRNNESSSSKRKLNFYENHQTKKPKIKKSNNSMETHSERENPQIEKMQARVKSLMTEMRDLENKLEKYQHVVPENLNNVKNPNTVSSNGNDSPIVKGGNASSAYYSKPRTNGSAYCRWQSISNYDVDKNGMVRIGDGHARVPARLLKQLEGTYYTNAVRKLLTSVFSRRMLATHSLTGKPSPAFPNKPAKKQLDSALVNDIIQTVCENCNVEENLVRISITTKCADESKMFRSRKNNKKQRSRSKKENWLLQDSSSEESYE